MTTLAPRRRPPTSDRPNPASSGSEGQPTGGSQIMTLIGLIVVLVIVGLLMYLINAFIPMDASIKRLLNVVVIVFLIIWLLQAFGLFGSLSDIRIGR